MKVLSIEQMNQLKEFGVDTSKASMAIYNIYAGEKKEYDILSSNGAFSEKQEHDRFGYGIHNIVAFDKKPVFTLQDIIELLPGKLIYEESNLYLTFENIDNEYGFCYVACDYEVRIYFNNTDILQAAFEMLVWVAENGYLKTK